MTTEFRRGVLVASVMLLSGCYHQVVATGLSAGTTKIDKPWTSTFIFGLVEAKPIDVREQCKSGVAFVDSRFEVLNWLGAVVTLGIWVPWHVTVTCASGGSASLDSAVPTIALDASVRSLVEAARLAREHGSPVALVWDPSTPAPEVSR
ncbi:MAG: hypothetical protein ABI910_02460 [Gemmatimonadota bacterium]